MYVCAAMWRNKDTYILSCHFCSSVLRHFIVCRSRINPFTKASLLGRIRTSKVQDRARRLGLTLRRLATVNKRDWDEAAASIGLSDLNQIRVRPKFGFGFGYGAETDLTAWLRLRPKCNVTNSVSAETLRRNCKIGPNCNTAAVWKLGYCLYTMVTRRCLCQLV